VEPAPPTREDKLRFIFAFVIVYAGVLFLVRPHPTEGQVHFRVLLVLIGASGLVALYLRSRGGSHK
jgi:hypothetical protein